MTVEVIVHIHPSNTYTHKKFNFDIQTIKPFIVPVMSFKGHSRSLAMSSFIRLPRLSIREQTGKVDITYFQRKLAQMSLKVDSIDVDLTKNVT